MGIYSRDYLRRDDGIRGKTVYWIMGVTVAVYALQGVVLGRGEIDLAGLFGVVPRQLVGKGWLWQLVTHALLHEPYQIWHLAFNMLFLYWMGLDVAEIYGVRRFLFLYVGGAVSCALAYTATAYAVGRTDIPAIGASGAIMAVAVVGAFLFPSRTVVFMYVIPMPLWMLVAFYVGLDLYYPLAGLRSWLDSAGHLGGALFGFVCHRFHLEAPDAGRFLAWVRTLSVSGPGSSADVDRILDKISAQGIGSLTEAERDVLDRAAKKR
ncbi:MAG TPA: rhomboid family intramembrane serine protease [Planctomycetota bacterium]|nr:rhomboid family intramembrane serine protease [Planctomycetota bacterium]